MDLLKEVEKFLLERVLKPVREKNKDKLHGDALVTYEEADMLHYRIQRALAKAGK